MLEIYLIIYAAMIATSFWEAYVEGKNPWDHGKLGWKIRYKHHTILTAYHFWLFWVMYPLLIMLPLVVAGFSWKLFGVLISAYTSGLIVEDFFWFVVNPVFKMRHYNSKHVKWYPWLKFGNFEVPAYYLVGLTLSFLSWFIFVRGA
jgi:hypothetical protein